MVFQNYIILDGIRYDYESGSWNKTVPIKSSRNTTQTQAAFQYIGLDRPSHRITLIMQSALTIWGVTTVGETQLNSFITTLSKVGSSMPVLFVDPTGVTQQVVPFGQYEQVQFRNHGSSVTPVEFKVNINLWQV